MSSNTAAPNNPVPNLLRIIFNSINVWADMLTLVAARINPMKMEVCNFIEKSNPIPVPSINGNITPNVPAKPATLLERIKSEMCRSNPARNIRSKTPISARLWISFDRF
jgi:hypothetical protein